MGNVHEACMKYMAWGAEHFQEPWSLSSKWMFCGFQECQNEPINSLVFLRVVVASREVWCVTIILTCTSHATCPSCSVCVCVKDNGFICCKATLLPFSRFIIAMFFVVFLWQQWNPTFESGVVCMQSWALCTVFHSHTGATHIQRQHCWDDIYTIPQTHKSSEMMTIKRAFIPAPLICVCGAGSHHVAH